MQISYNNITSLSKPPPNLFVNLKLLNIEGNNIKYWTEVEKLGYLPRSVVPTHYQENIYTYIWFIVKIVFKQFNFLSWPEKLVIATQLLKNLL